MHSHKILRPDSKGRVTLGNLFSYCVSGFKMKVDDEQRIILEPMVEIPAREQWLFDNPVALQQVKQGLKDAQEGRLVKRDFSEYLTNDD